MSSESGGIYGVFLSLFFLLRYLSTCRSEVLLFSSPLGISLNLTPWGISESCNAAHVGDAGQQLRSCTWIGLEWL